MSRQTIIIALVVVLVVGGGVYWWQVNRTSTTSGPGATLPNVNGATNASAIPVEIPPLSAKGDRTVDRSADFRGLTFTVSTAQETQEVRRRQAGENEKFVVLFFRPFPTAPSADPVTWASADLRLADADGLTHPPVEVALPKSADVPGGYAIFSVPRTASGFTLVFGSDQRAPNIDLGF